MGAEMADLANSDLTASIRDLALHLHRGNSGLAESLVERIAKTLKDIIHSDADPQSFPMLRAQQTMFAIDEVRLLMSQRDFSGALDAARDAGKEWKQRPAAEPV